MAHQIREATSKALSGCQGSQFMLAANEQAPWHQILGSQSGMTARKEEPGASMTKKGGKETSKKQRRKEKEKRRRRRWRECKRRRARNKHCVTGCARRSRKKKDATDKLKPFRRWKWDRERREKWTRLGRGMGEEMTRKVKRKRITTPRRM